MWMALTLRLKSLVNLCFLMSEAGWVIPACFFSKIMFLIHLKIIKFIL
jgi:hypothetical protein